MTPSRPLSIFPLIPKVRKNLRFRTSVHDSVHTSVSPVFLCYQLRVRNYRRQHTSVHDSVHTSVSPFFLCYQESEMIDDNTRQFMTQSRRLSLFPPRYQLILQSESTNRHVNPCMSHARPLFITSSATETPE